MAWKLQSWLWMVLPGDREMNHSIRWFGLLLAVCALVYLIGLVFRQRRLRRAGLYGAVGFLILWGALYLARPAWLKAATQPIVPVPDVPVVEWTTRAPGFETAEIDVRADGRVVDCMALVRLDSQRFPLSVHWDPTGSRTAEDWQRELGAAVVVNGSYFAHDFTPLTPLRQQGKSLGPPDYQSDHGAFVADGGKAQILDLKGRDVFQAINAYPEAIVSYPLLLGPERENRARDTKGWLASRNFVGTDGEGRVILGTTKTGFFTLRRLGDFLRDAPLDLRMALNFDGGPLVSQVVRVGDYERNFHGRAEINHGSDVVRVFWHEVYRAPWTLPIVLVATPAAK